MNNVQVTLFCSIMLAAMIFITGDNPLLWIIITLIILGLVFINSIEKV